MKRQLESRASIALALGVEMARTTLGFTKMELADRAGCTPQHVSNIEGRLCNPSQALISDIADALGKTPAELYQLGEIQLELQTLEIVRERRQRVRQERDLEAMMEAVGDLDPASLSTLAEALRQASDR